MVVFLELLIVLVVLTLAFDFVNGFHDAANAIATIVATRVLTPSKAVALAAVGNFVGMFLLTNAIAEFVGKGIVSKDALGVGTPGLEAQALALLLAGVFGAIAWDLVTWWWGLPTSSSHALIGGLMGATVAGLGVAAVQWGGIGRVVLFMVAAPLLGLAATFLFAIAIMRALRHQAPDRVNRWFRDLQLVSSFFYSITHGTNDAQKGIGIITLALAIAAVAPPWGPPAGEFHVPFWVLFAAHAAISIGTLFGGWRIVRTMSHRVTHLSAWQGFSAESASGLVLFGTATGGIPVSTTHVITGSILGVGATRRLSAVRWGVARQVVFAWVLTIPMAALTAISVYVVLAYVLGLAAPSLWVLAVAFGFPATLAAAGAVTLFRSRQARARALQALWGGKPL